jgi:hypothetical protein
MKVLYVRDNSLFIFFINRDKYIFYTILSFEDIHVCFSEYFFATPNIYVMQTDLSSDIFLNECIENERSLI